MPAIVLNGEPKELPEGASAADAVRASGADERARGVAVALDGEVVPRGDWSSTQLTDGGHVEVLTAVQGG